MNGELFNLLEQDPLDPFTSKLALYPQLESLFKSTFSKPFLEPLDKDDVISVGLSGLSQGPDCIKTVILQPETSLDTVVDQLSKMFDGYIQYYAQYPQMSHFSPYSGEEIATLAEHLKKKLREISSSNSQVVFLILNRSLFRS